MYNTLRVNELILEEKVNKKGQALVEFVIILPVLIMLFLGTKDSKSILR